MTTQKDLNYYLSLPYTIQLIREDEETWFARVLELPGCMTEGDSAEEAVEMIFDAMAGWLEVALEDSRSIPEPRPTENYSGKFVVRVPRTLHRQLVESSDREGVSLNQYINVVLAEGLGHPGSTSGNAPKLQNWPGLTVAMRNALVMAGIGDEAGKLDERLFADWIDHSLADIERNVRGGFFQDALKNLDQMTIIVQQNAALSPICDVLGQLFAFQRQLIEMFVRAQQGIVQEQIVRAQISQLIQQVNIGQPLIAEERRQYSQASAQPDMLLSEGLFKSTVKVGAANAW